MAKVLPAVSRCRRWWWKLSQAPFTAAEDSAASSAVSSGQRCAAGCREVQISLVELAAPQWPKCVRANGVRVAQHLFAADDAHGAGRARADWARGVCRTLAQPAVRKMIALATHARQLAGVGPCSRTCGDALARGTPSGTVHKTILLRSRLHTALPLQSRAKTHLMTLT
jgi:hypothetical protein